MFGCVLQPTEAAFSTDIVRLWLSMARDGAPSAPGVVHWPPFDEGAQSCLMIGAPPTAARYHDPTITVSEGQSAAICDFWDEQFEAGHDCSPR